MKQAQRKDFFMEIRRSLNRYFSILFIVALGVAFFSGVRATEPDMRLSVDAVADESNFMDFRILSTMGLTEGDLEQIRRIPGVTAAEGEYSMDALCHYGEKELVLHVSSMPQNINMVNIKEGRLPEKQGECFLDEQLLVSTDYGLGDQITLYSGTDEPLSDTLGTETYTIVGIGTSPYYLNFDRGNSSIGNGDIKGFLMVPEEDFSLDVYTQIYAAADGLDGFVTAGGRYQAEAEKIADAIEDIAGERCWVRLAEIRGDAQEEIGEAEQKLQEKEEEAEQKLRDAWLKIEDGENELEVGRDEIAENEQKLRDAEDTLFEKEQKLADGKAQLELNEQKAADAKELLAEKQEELQNSREKLETAREELEEGKSLAGEGRAQLEAAREELTAKGEDLTAGWEEYKSGLADAESSQAALDIQRGKLEELRAGLEAAGLNPEKNEEYFLGKQALDANQAKLDGVFQYLDGVKGELTGLQAQYDQGMAALEKKETEMSEQESALTAAEAEIQNGEVQIQDGEAALLELQNGIRDGEQGLSDGRQEIADGETALEEGRQEIADGKQQLEEAKEKLSEGETELQEAKAEYEDARDEADEKIAEARSEIEEAKEALEDLEEPEWYVLDRKSVQSYVEFDNDTKRIGAIGKVFPVIFFLVAALVSLTTMTRMVEEKRTEIGTMKALGYSTLSIASKYILYALSASLLGSIAGFLIGEKLLPWVIITTYKILYGNLSIIRIPYNWGYAFGATAIAVVCTTGATLAACCKETLAQPSQLMRPVAPMKGKKILLERIRPMWRLMNFSQKSTLRNLFRYKKRLLMTVFGIGACMALLIVGFGLRDSIYTVSDGQYGELWLYDASASIATDGGREEKEAFYEEMDGDENISEYLGAYTASMDGEANGVTKAVNLVVPEDLERFPDFFVLRGRLSGEEYTLDEEGAVINEKLAKLLDIREGDSFYLKESDTSRVPVKISHITENYVYNYIYMSPSLYQQLYGREAECNTEYLKLKDAQEEKGRELSKRLLEHDVVSGVVLVSDMNKTIMDMLGSLDTVVWVLIISAGLLAFVVLYNLNNINITERRRELATIKLLGFYDLELASYVYRENVLLTFIGIAAGIFMGNILHRFVIETVEVDLIMFGRVVHPLSYLWGIVLTLLFAFLVNAAMFYKLRKIDMVESLKSVE
ncbi:FtsX-like permease family protein [Lacrimispora sp. NSJ-141]|uniref:FtsX-like permease family protein n=1 Tax=Lientehia hominis TaxID=2897778 RepID=A0AAP2RJ75_9FIRM|nr:FtsX-like permease family protein [Lientehia hominis]MCD2493229.1 FtsX-like permease family protein [Lientehia hominis]